MTGRATPATLHAITSGAGVTLRLERFSNHNSSARSPVRDERGFCQPLKKSAERVSAEVTKMWLMPLLSGKYPRLFWVRSISHQIWIITAKKAYTIESEGKSRDERLWSAYLQRRWRRIEQLADWAERMFASHARFHMHDTDLLPTRAYVKRTFESLAEANDARNSFDGFLDLKRPEDTEQGAQVLEWLVRVEDNYRNCSQALATLQVLVDVITKRQGIPRHTVQEVKQVAQSENGKFLALSRPEALFYCDQCSPDVTPRSWREVHAHLRREHPRVYGLFRFREDGTLATMFSTSVRLWPGASLAQAIVSELGLGKNTTIARMSGLVASRELSCSCGALEEWPQVSLDWPTFVSLPSFTLPYRLFLGPFQVRRLT